MNVNIKVPCTTQKSGHEIKTVSLFEIVYECEPERFKSLRLSKGSFPSNVVLDYKDHVVSFEQPFLSDLNDIDELVEWFELLNFDGSNQLKTNWFIWNKGTKKEVISRYIENIKK